VTNNKRGQSLDGENLDLDLLDRRVSEWKAELGLFNQPEFPPRNVKMSEGAIRFHDRSHILVQDYLGKSSYDLRETYGETSLPPVYEELLTFFFSKVIHHSNSDPEEKTRLEVLREDILLMKHLGYITDDSVFIEDIACLSRELREFYLEIINKKDFALFKETLLASTRDCEDWEALEVRG
jgi:hypothetical protein